MSSSAGSKRGGWRVQTLNRWPFKSFLLLRRRLSPGLCARPFFPSEWCATTVTNEKSNVSRQSPLLAGLSMGYAAAAGVARAIDKMRGSQ